MPAKRIRVSGKQREDIDLDLLVQALLMIGEQRYREQEPQAASARDDASPEDTPGATA